jgi:hypothetical protein
VYTLAVVVFSLVFFWAGLRIIDARSKPKFRHVGFGQVMQVPRKHRTKRTHRKNVMVRNAAVAVVVAVRSERPRLATVELTSVGEPSADVVDVRAVEEAGAATPIPDAVLAVLFSAAILGFLALVIWANTAG